MTVKQPKMFSSDPEALKAADPRTLTEAQRNYRDLLISQETERLMRYGKSPDYLREVALRLAEEAQRRSPKPVAPEQSWDDLEPVKPKTDAFS